MSRFVALVMLAWFAVSLQGAQGAFLIQVGLGQPQILGSSAIIPVEIVFTSENPAAPENDFVNAYFFDLSNSSEALRENNYARISVEEVLDGWQFDLDPDSGLGGVFDTEGAFVFASSPQNPTPVKLFDFRIDLSNLADGSYLLSVFNAELTDASGSIAQDINQIGEWEQRTVPFFGEYPAEPWYRPGTIEFDGPDLPGSVRFETGSQPIPEPATVVMFTIGASALVGLTARRKKR